ncbi:MAG: hypothetical protein ACI4ED_04735 [Suilimivivens sp.]
MKLHITQKSSAIFRIIAVLLTCFTLLLSGCGNEEELEFYKTNMNQFFENIKVFDSSINSIDPESDTAVTELLSLLDSMDKSFAQMASLEVPEGFPGVEQLADEASEYMTEAVSYYHQAFEGETYDSALADVAKQNYDRANVRVQYIVSILHGDIPEDIFVYDTEDSEVSEDSNVVEDTDDTEDQEDTSDGFDIMDIFPQ